MFTLLAVRREDPNMIRITATGDTETMREIDVEGRLKAGTASRKTLLMVRVEVVARDVIWHNQGALFLDVFHHIGWRLGSQPGRFFTQSTTCTAVARAMTAATVDSALEVGPRERMSPKAMGFSQGNGPGGLTPGHVFVGRDRLATVRLATGTEAAQVIPFHGRSQVSTKRNKGKAVGLVLTPTPLELPVAVPRLGSHPQSMPVRVTLATVADVAQLDLVEKIQPFTAGNGARNKRRTRGDVAP